MLARFSLAARALAPLALLTVLALAAPAGAATTVGSDLTRTPDQTDACVSKTPCTFVQTAAPGNPQPLTVPADGVVVRWRVRTGPDTAAALRLVLMRPASGGEYVADRILTGATTSNVAGVQTFDVTPGAAVQAGDALGLQQVTTTAGGLIAAAAPGATGEWWEPALGTGASGPPSFGEDDVELLFNADVEPDVDHDGYGDETRDRCPADASRSGPCPTDIRVTNAADPVSLFYGEQTTNTVTVRNAGVHPATVPLSWRVTSPSSTSIVSTSGPCTPALNTPGTGPTCNLGVLTPGQSVVLSAVIGSGTAGVPPSLINAAGSSWAQVVVEANEAGSGALATATWTYRSRPIPPDRTPPVLTVKAAAQRIATVLRKGLRVSVGGGEASSGTVAVRVRRPGRSSLPAGSRSWRAADARPTSRSVWLNRAARALLRKARRSVELEIRVTGRDRAGNAGKLVVRRIVVRR